MNIYEILILLSSASARNKVLSKEEKKGEYRAWACGTTQKRLDVVIHDMQKILLPISQDIFTFIYLGARGSGGMCGGQRTTFEKGPLLLPYGFWARTEVGRLNSRHLLIITFRSLSASS